MRVMIYSKRGPLICGVTHVLLAIIPTIADSEGLRILQTIRHTVPSSSILLSRPDLTPQAIKGNVMISLH